MSPGSNSSKVQWSVMARELLDRRILALLARGIDRFEIVNTLNQPMRPTAGQPRMLEPNPFYTINPRTNKPFSQSTIYAHAQAILNNWRQRDQEHLDQVYAGIIGSTEEARREAWARGNLDVVLACNAFLAKLIGAYAPTKIEVVPPPEFDPRKLSNEQLDAAIDGASYEEVMGMLDGGEGSG